MKIKNVIETESGSGEITMKYAEDTFNELLAFQGYGFCLGYDTVVEVKDKGNVLLGKLKGGEFIKAPSMIADETKWVKVTQIIPMGYKQVYKATLSNQTSIICTKDHKFFCSDYRKHTMEEIVRNKFCGKPAESLWIFCEKELADIVSWEEFSEKMPVMDITVDSDEHLFYANGIATSNCSAHALCYGVYSAVQLWLQEHYFIDYMSILLNHIHRGDKDKKTGGSVIDERVRYCIENGVSVRYPNVNKSTDKWEIVNGASLLCPLLNIKGFSSADTELIVKNRPYDSVCDFMDKNKFSKGKFEALLFSNALSDFGDVETLYNWYYNEYTNKSKKKKSNDGFFDFGDGFNDEPVEDVKQVHFSKSELDDASFEYNGFVVDDNMLAKYAEIYKTGLKYFFEGNNRRILSISMAVKESLEPKKGHEDEDENSKERFVLAKLRSKEMVTTKWYSYCLMNFTDGRDYLSVREYNSANYDLFKKGHEYLVPIWFANGKPSISGHFIEKNELVDLENVKKRSY